MLQIAFFYYHTQWKHAQNQIAFTLSVYMCAISDLLLCKTDQPTGMAKLLNMYY